MPIDNTLVMEKRAENFNNFEKTANKLEELLSNSNVIAFAHKNKKHIQEIANGNYIRGGIKLFITNIFSGDLWKILSNITTILDVYKNIDKPEMQKLLVEKTSLLEHIGENKEVIKELLDDLVFTEQTKAITKKLTGATLDLLGDKSSRDKLKTELVNNYFKFSLNSFDRKNLIENFAEYEKSQITDKINNKVDLVKLLKAKSDIRLGDSNFKLKKAIKSLDTLLTEQQISDKLKDQLTIELQILGLNQDSINTLIPNNLVSLKGAQGILQKQYESTLDSKTEQMSNAIANGTGQSQLIDNILREHAAYVVDVQEPLYQQNYVDDYVRFHQENNSPKSRDELREEAIQNSYGLATDYMRLAQNVLRIVDSLPDQDPNNIIETASPNLKALLKKRGDEVINFAKGFVGDSGNLRDKLTGFGITDEVLDLAPLILSEDGGIAKIANVTESIRTKPVFEWAKDILTLLNSNTELQQKFINNPKMAGNLAKGMVNSIPFLKNLCQDLGSTDQVLDIISILVKTPEQTQLLLGHLNKGEYVELTKKFIEIANSNEELRTYLTNHKEVYKNLITSLFKEIDLMRNIQTSFGITNAELGEVLDSGLGVLNNLEKFTELIVVSKQISDTISEYMTKNNISKFADLTKNDYIELTKSILQNDELVTLLETNKEAVGKFAKLLTEKIPALRAAKTQYLGEVAVDTFVTNLIESGVLRNRENVSVMLDRYSGNGYKVVDLFSYIYRSSSILKNLLSVAPIRDLISSTTIDQNLTNSIKSIVNSNTTANSLSELLTSDANDAIKNLGSTKKLDGIILDSIDFSKVKKIHEFSFTSAQLSRAHFQGTEIEHTSFANSMFKHGVNFEGANLQNVDFSNSGFSTYNLEKLYLPTRYNAIGQTNNEYKISFKNSTLTNVNFTGIDLVKKTRARDDIKIDFGGATLDPATLDSLISAIRKTPELKDKINLVGAKVVGDLSERDLSNLNLKGVDLTGVSSLKGTVIKNANLKSTSINSELLKETLQLEGIETDLTSEQLDKINTQQQQNRESVITKKISKVIVDKLVSDGKLVANDTTKTSLFIEKLSTEINLLEESEKQFLYNLFEENYTSLGQFTITPNKIKHYADLSQAPQAILNALYNSAFTGNELSDSNLANALKYEYMKNLIADEVGKELFGEGQNRGKDFLIIRNYLASVFNRLSNEEKENLYEQTCTIDGSIKLNQSDKRQLLIQSLKNQYYDKTRYTTAGVATSGVYIPTTDALDGFLTSDVNKIKSIAELKNISELSNAVGEKIGEKLFGDNMSSSRQADTQKIINYLNNHVFPSVLCSLPEDDKRVFLNNPNTELLVGDFNRDTMLGARTVDVNSLSQLFYNATSYTKTGSVTGGLQLNSTTLATQEFFDSVTNCIESKCHTESVEIEKLAQQIGEKLGEKLFGADMSGSRELDTQKIINTLRDSVIPQILQNLSEAEQNKLLTTHNIDTLVGDYRSSGISGYWSSETHPKSLSQIFYDNSSYTKTGYATGGIQISDTQLSSAAFLEKVKNQIKTSLSNGRQM